MTKMEQEMLERELKENADKMDLGEIHNGYRLRIIRPEPTLEQIARYEVMKRRWMQLQKNGTVDCPAFGGTGKISERDGTGEKVCGSQIYRRDGRIFRSRNIPGNQDAAVGVLIDESASMDIHNRIGSARYTACVIYRFCQRLGIPVLILGHSTGIGEKKRVLSCIPMQNLTHGIKRTVFALRESVPDGTIETGLPWHTQGCGLEKS